MFLAAMMLFPAVVRAQNKATFWFQQDGTTSQLGSVTNPVISVGVGKTRQLYLWFTKDAAPLGFEGVSLDVRLLSSDGGSASAALSIDTPPGRWSGATAGVSRTDSGGVGVAACNAFDLTNADTLGTNANRFAVVNFTGVARGTVQVFLAVGDLGIADSGQNAVVWFGFKQGQVFPENLNLSGGSYGQVSLVADAVINVIPKVGDFDGDGDLDQEDFGKFQACMLGPDVAQDDPNCDDALLDVGDDVDAADFEIFAGCMTQPGEPIDPNCR